MILKINKFLKFFLNSYSSSYVNERDRFIISFIVYLSECKQTWKIQMIGFLGNPRRKSFGNRVITEKGVIHSWIHDNCDIM